MFLMCALFQCWLHLIRTQTAYKNTKTMRIIAAIVIALSNITSQQTHPHLHSGGVRKLCIAQHPHKVLEDAQNNRK